MRDGWTNRATRTLWLWIKWQREAMDYWLMMAARSVQRVGNRDDAIPDLSQLMQTEYTARASETFGEPGPLTEILDAALSEVDWLALSEALVDEVMDKQEREQLEEVTG